LSPRPVAVWYGIRVFFFFTSGEVDGADVVLSLALSFATAVAAAVSGAPPCGAAMAEGAAMEADSKVLVFVAHVQRELK
jgi:hypothetical protein